MGVTRLQMQNFLIFLLDLVGVTVGYLAAVWLRFGNIETGYTVMGNDTYYRWLIAIVVLMMIYFGIHLKVVPFCVSWLLDGRIHIIVGSLRS